MCLAVPSEVSRVQGDTAVCKVHGGQTEIQVSLLLLDETVLPGDFVLIHAGFALRRLDVHEARETLALLQEMGHKVQQT